MSFTLNDDQGNMSVYVVIVIAIQIMFKKLYKIYLKFNLGSLIKWSLK